MSAHLQSAFTQVFLRIGKPDIITNSDQTYIFAIFIIILFLVG